MASTNDHINTIVTKLQEIPQISTAIYKVSQKTMPGETPFVLVLAENQQNLGPHSFRKDRIETEIRIELYDAYIDGAEEQIELENNGVVDDIKNKINEIVRLGFGLEVFAAYFQGNRSVEEIVGKKYVIWEFTIKVTEFELVG